MSEANMFSATQEPDLLPRPARVKTIPKKGLRMTITPDKNEKVHLCAFYDLQEIEDFEAKVFLERVTTTKFHLTGRVIAHVVQTCVFSLEPVETQIDEAIDLFLVPAQEFHQYAERIDGEGSLILGLEVDAPDIYEQDVIALGSLVLEHFALGLDPYPRAQGAEFDKSALADNIISSPFGELAALKGKMKPV